MTCSLRGTVRVDSLRARFPESLGLRHNAPGDIRVEEAPIPTPGPGEVVIKNKVTLPCGTDVKTYKRGYRYEPPLALVMRLPALCMPWGTGWRSLRSAIVLSRTTQPPVVTATTASMVRNPCVRA